MDHSPSIASDFFDNACRELELYLREHLIECNHIRQEEQIYLIIRHAVVDQEPVQNSDGDTDYDDEVVQESEPDPACLDRMPSGFRTIPVEYHIILSATYRVPVLYFQLLHPLNKAGANSVAQILEHIVPVLLRDQIESVGVLGAISLTHHPVIGRPFFCIHPCNTSEALCEIIGTRHVSPLEYMLIWLGLIGPAVGLHIHKAVEQERDEG